MSYNDYLEHHGIKGMKWGVRRYRNSDGTLTEAGKKRVSKKYDKFISRAERDTKFNAVHLYVKAHNDAADKMNRLYIKKYNDDYDKKLGDKAKNHDYFNDKEYNEGYEKLWNDVLNRSVDRVLHEYLADNRNMRKAIELVDKYKAYEFDDAVKANMDNINDIKRIMNGG